MLFIFDASMLHVATDAFVGSVRQDGDFFVVSLALKFVTAEVA